ncbi:MAG: signal peptidase I [Candidatus Omnitrophica bacterium]|nr:signal peptidase I [Candidatus Omnitrophota bacterium]
MPQKKQSLLWEYAESFIIAIALALVVRTFIIQPFKIPSGSMRPTLMEGDRILVNKYVYRFQGPTPGDIIVFKSPETPKKDFIKRLVGVGGDSIEIREGKIFANHRMLSEPPVFRENFYYNRGEYGAEGASTAVPDGHYFVLGDNSGSSHDSRFWGFVPKENLIGRAFFIFWPPHRMRVLK